MHIFSCVRLIYRVSMLRRLADDSTRLAEAEYDKDLDRRVRFHPRLTAASYALVARYSVEWLLSEYIASKG